MSHRPNPPRTPEGAWSASDRRDQLVEWHVLASHGDHDAARAAQAWLATDIEARRDWDTVQRACEQVRAATGPPDSSTRSPDRVQTHQPEEGDPS